MNIYAMNIPKRLTAGQMEMYLLNIPMERRERVKGYVREQDAIRSLCGSLLVQFVIWKELKIYNYSYSYNKYGKPTISGFPNFHFNLSHSDNWVVCATGKNEVGIDVEYIKEINLGIAERFFTPMEFMDISRRPVNEQLACFYEYWTMKESFIKMLGKGLSVPLNSFSIMKKDSTYFTIDQNSKVYFFIQLQLDKEYKLSVCSAKKISKTTIEYVDLDKINIGLSNC